MSTTDGETTSGSPADGDGAAPALPPRLGDVLHDDVWNVDGPDDHDAFSMPEIVPATATLPTIEQTGGVPPMPTAVPPAPVSQAATASVAAPGLPVVPAPAGPQPGPGVPTWSQHTTSPPLGASGAPLRAPGRRPRVRRVTRVLRHIDPWSTFKVALLFSAVAYLVALTSGVLLWRVADSTGTLANVERWFTQFGWETFELQGGEVFRNAWIIGLFAAVALTGGLVLLATLFNLVSDIIGGIRLTVLEEEVVEKTASSARRYVVRRAPLGESEPVDPSWDVGDDAPEALDATSPSATHAATTVSPPDTDGWSVDEGEDDGDGDDAASGENDRRHGSSG